MSGGVTAGATAEPAPAPVEVDTDFTVEPRPGGMGSHPILVSQSTKLQLA